MSKKTRTPTLADALFKDSRRMNSKAKGNLHERRVAALLTEWTGEEFNRTPGSGGLRWIEASRIAGDVVAPAKSSFPFVVEVKAYKKLHVPAQLGKRSMMYRFFEQAYRDAARVGRWILPIVFARQNGMPRDEYYVIVGEETADNLCDLGLDARSNGAYNSEVAQRRISIYIYNSRDVLDVSYPWLLNRLVWGED